MNNLKFGLPEQMLILIKVQRRLILHLLFLILLKNIDENYNIVLIDTAGRLHNKTNLMNELDKIRRVIKKLIPNAIRNAINSRW